VLGHPPGRQLGRFHLDHSSLYYFIKRPWDGNVLVLTRTAQNGFALRSSPETVISRGGSRRGSYNESLPIHLWLIQQGALRMFVSRANVSVRNAIQIGCDATTTRSWFEITRNGPGQLRLMTLRSPQRQQVETLAIRCTHTLRLVSQAKCN
jgi:hypothetical protein